MAKRMRTVAFTFMVLLGAARSSLWGAEPGWPLSVGAGPGRPKTEIVRIGGLAHVSSNSYKMAFHSRRGMKTTVFRRPPKAIMRPNIRSSTSLTLTPRKEKLTCTAHCEYCCCSRCWSPGQVFDRQSLRRMTASCGSSSLAVIPTTRNTKPAAPPRNGPSWGIT